MAERQEQLEDTTMRTDFRTTTSLHGATGMPRGRRIFQRSLRLVSSLVCISGVGVALSAFGDQNPPNCLLTFAFQLEVFDSATNTVAGGNLSVGQIVYYRATLSQDGTGCAVEGGQLIIITPDGATNNATSGPIPLICGAPDCSPAGTSVFHSAYIPYTVRVQDIGQGSFPFNNSIRIQAFGYYVGGTSHCGGSDCFIDPSVTACNPVVGNPNPPGCSPATGLQLSVYTANSTQSVDGAGLVVGETVLYRASLFQFIDSNCGVEGGHLDIRTPDGATTNATSGQTIPLICGSPGCSPGGISVFYSAYIPYTVRVEDIGRFGACPVTYSTGFLAQVTYTGGISHCAAAVCDATATTSTCNPFGATTPAGTNIMIRPFPDGAVMFETVISDGYSSGTVTNSGPTEPLGFAVACSSNYFELTSSAVFTGQTTVCFNYSALCTNGAPESAFRLFHYEHSAWVDVTTSIDTTNNIVCGVVTNFSLFATFQSLFSGFFPPVDNPTAVNVLKAGRAVPVKFSLGGNQGLDIFAPSF